MCGRYALGIRATFVRYQLQQQGLPVDNAPEDDVARETYNFPPGSYGLVYRAEVPDNGLRDNDEAPQEASNDPSSTTTNTDGDAGDTTQPDTDKDTTIERPNHQFKYELKAMKWGLIPFWTKRSPDYGSMLRTINCRDDSLSQSSGLWTTMKARKRCLVIAQGFYEWLKKGPPGTKQEKIPHFVKRKDGQLMCFAGLWDCVHYEDTPAEDKLYTYTIITTDSNKQLSFLHDRMPVILDPNTEAMKLWLDPSANKWNNDLQSILKPFEGELECYPVNKDVGKVGNNDPSFIIPIDSKENKKNIANFFDNARKNESPMKSKQAKTEATSPPSTSTKVKKEVEEDHQDGDTRMTKDHSDSENHAPLPVPPPSQGGTKRKADIDDEGDHNRNEKQPKTESTSDAESHNKSHAKSPAKTPSKSDTKSSNKMSESPQGKGTNSPAKTPTPVKPSGTTRKTRSATSNEGISKKPSPVKADGSQRITSFFGSKDGG